MDEFDAAQFQGEYATPEGKRLWALLNRGDVIADSDDAAQSFRHDRARCSEMIPPT
jgi:hypothetical protein